MVTKLCASRVTNTYPALPRREVEKYTKLQLILLATRSGFNKMQWSSLNCFLLGVS